MTGGASGDVWKMLSTARTIQRFTDEPVDDETLRRCLEAATSRRAVDMPTPCPSRIRPWGARSPR